MLYKAKNDDCRKDTSIPKTKNKKDTPIWLNSFLSIFVPSCSIDLIDPGLVNAIKEDELKVKEERKKTLLIRSSMFKAKVFKTNKIYQRKVISRQVICSSFIILITLIVIFFLVREPESDWNYFSNRLQWEDFKIFFSVLVGMSFLSIIFFKDIDIFDICCMNKEKKKGRVTGKPLKKALVVLMSTIFLLRCTSES